MNAISADTSSDQSPAAKENLTVFWIGSQDYGAGRRRNHADDNTATAANISHPERIGRLPRSVIRPAARR